MQHLDVLFFGLVQHTITREKVSPSTLNHAEIGWMKAEEFLQEANKLAKKVKKRKIKSIRPLERYNFDDLTSLLYKYQNLTYDLSYCGDIVELCYFIKAINKEYHEAYIEPLEHLAIAYHHICDTPSNANSISRLLDLYIKIKIEDINYTEVDYFKRQSEILATEVKDDLVTAVIHHCVKPKFRDMFDLLIKSLLHCAKRNYKEGNKQNSILMSIYALPIILDIRGISNQYASISPLMKDKDDYIVVLADYESIGVNITSKIRRQIGEILGYEATIKPFGDNGAMAIVFDPNELPPALKSIAERNNVKDYIDYMQV